MKKAHRLGTDEAERRLKAKLNLVRASYGRQLDNLHEEWKDHILTFAFKVLGIKVAGTVTVEDSEERLAVDVPFAVAILRSAIEKRIRAELDPVLS